MLKIIQNIENILNKAYQTEWQTIKSETIDKTSDILASFVGKNEGEKRSLINMLLDENLFPTEMNIKPIPPVHIFYGSNIAVHKIMANGKRISIKPTDFYASTDLDDPDIECIEITASLPWLIGLTIIIVPATDEFHSKYMSISDALLLVLSGEKPSDDDLATIKFMAATGKEIWIGLNKLDISLDDNNKSTKPLLDINEWESSIQRDVGVHFPVVPISPNGTGKFALTYFLKSLVENRDEIRQKQFQIAEFNLLEKACKDLINRNSELEYSVKTLAQLKTDNENVIKSLNSQMAQQNKKLEQDVSSLQSAKEKIKLDNENIINSLKSQLNDKDKKFTQELAAKEKLKLDNEKIINSLKSQISNIEKKYTQDLSSLQTEKENLKLDNEKRINSLLSQLSDIQKKYSQESSDLRTEKIDMGHRLNDLYQANRVLTNELNSKKNKSFIKKLFK